MSSGDTARQAPDVEGLLRAWLQTQECKERGLHLLRADDFQGVCDGHLVEARLSKGDYREINPPVPPRGRRSAAERSNRFVREASPGTGRARLEIARRRREATLLGEQLQKCNKIGPRAAPAARPAWPVARESPSSITGASAAENTAPRRHFVRMHSVTEQLDVEICQDDTAPARPSESLRPAAAWPAGATFPWPLSRESPSSMSRAQEAIARRRHEASRLCEELRKKMDPIPNCAGCTGSGVQF